ncbi:MAG: TetR/AcrR family transcriptional regulator, partial [Merdibacter sp.]
MEEKISATLESIQQAAMQEFLDKGFQGASLRQIVKNAGVTTGAFYGYFSSKEALFNA